jgi:hypothetical protein
MRRRCLVAIALLVASCLDGTCAIAQTLSIVGSRFAVDRDGGGAAPRPLLFISYFDGLRAASLNEDLDYISATLHFDGIRVLPNWQQRALSYCPEETADRLFDASGAVRGDGAAAAGPLKRLIDLIVAAGARGLIVDVTFTRETVPGLSVDNYVRAVAHTATLLRPYRNVLFDLQNEIDKNVLPEADTKRLRDAVAAADPGRVVVASRGGPPADVIAYNRRIGSAAIAYHDPRVSNWGEQTGSVTAALVASEMPVYLQEPQGWNSGLTICGRVEGKTLDADGDPEHFRTAVEQARAAGAAAWTFHTRQGFRLNAGGPLRSRVQANPTERSLLEGAPGKPALSTIARGGATTSR